VHRLLRGFSYDDHLMSIYLFIIILFVCPTDLFLWSSLRVFVLTMEKDISRKCQEDDPTYECNRLLAKSGRLSPWLTTHFVSSTSSAISLYRMTVIQQNDRILLNIERRTFVASFRSGFHWIFSFRPKVSSSPSTCIRRRPVFLCGNLCYFPPWIVLQWMGQIFQRKMYQPPTATPAITQAGRSIVTCIFRVSPPPFAHSNDCVGTSCDVESLGWSWGPITGCLCWVTPEWRLFERKKSSCCWGPGDVGC